MAQRSFHLYAVVPVDLESAIDLLTDLARHRALHRTAPTTYTSSVPAAPGCTIEAVTHARTFRLLPAVVG